MGWSDLPPAHPCSGSLCGCHQGPPSTSEGRGPWLPTLSLCCGPVQGVHTNCTSLLASLQERGEGLPGSSSGWIPGHSPGPRESTPEKEHQAQGLLEEGSSQKGRLAPRQESCVFPRINAGSRSTDRHMKDETVFLRLLIPTRVPSAGGGAIRQARGGRILGPIVLMETLWWLPLCVRSLGFSLCHQNQGRSPNSSASFQESADSLAQWMLFPTQSVSPVCEAQLGSHCQAPNTPAPLESHPGVGPVGTCGSHTSPVCQGRGQLEKAPCCPIPAHDFGKAGRL